MSNPGNFNIQNTNNAANTLDSHDKTSRSRNVKLPAFTGNSNGSWKVWVSRFSTVADLNNWNDTTRLSELVQKLQGTAADFVFDEIPSETISNFHSLVRELSLRFQTVETNKTFRVQFGKRTQRTGESVEDYSTELKRIYDKAFPWRNPEMRRQLFLQQFLSGLRDKLAKFVVELMMIVIVRKALHIVQGHFHLPMVVERNKVLEKSKPRPLHQKQNRPVIL